MCTVLLQLNVWMLTLHSDRKGCLRPLNFIKMPLVQKHLCQRAWSSSSVEVSSPLLLTPATTGERKVDVKRNPSGWETHGDPSPPEGTQNYFWRNSRVLGLGEWRKKAKGQWFVTIFVALFLWPRQPCESGRPGVFSLESQTRKLKLRLGHRADKAKGLGLKPRSEP